MIGIGARRSVALALLAALAALARTGEAQAPHAPAAPLREARGSVHRVTAKGEVPLAGNWVVLHRVGSDLAAPVDSVRTDAAGRFAFRYRATGDTSALFFVASSYGGIAYFTPPLKKPVVAGGDADLLVYDTTSAPIPLTVRGRHVIITAPDTGKGRLVLEVFEVSNDTSVTRIAGTPERPTFATPLPEGATGAVAADGDIPADAVKFENGRALVFAPIAPGVKQFSFHYRVPVSKAPIAFPVLAAASVLEVLVEDTQGSATGAKLKKMASVNLDGRPFRRFLAQDAPANSVVTVIAPTQAGRAFSTRIALVVVGIGAAMLAGLAASLMRRGPLVARASELGDADPDDVARKIAALDDAFEQVENPTADQRADHYETRARLKARLTSAIARRDGL
ncbi:MAG TPA: hypothetical protein VN613_08480 [Gemmatimonadaceae bacterium]|nr:hypothetical protein [Gemmatimonadaceae bacterium]